MLLGSFSADTITFCYPDWCLIAVSTLGICVMMKDNVIVCWVFRLSVIQNNNDGNSYHFMQIFST